MIDTLAFSHLNVHDGISSACPLLPGQTSFSTNISVPGRPGGEAGMGQRRGMQSPGAVISLSSTLGRAGRVLSVCGSVETMAKFNLVRLLMCAKYKRLTSEDYIRLGLCVPEDCQDCVNGHGHYVKNDKMVSCLCNYFNWTPNIFGPMLKVKMVS